MKFLKTKNDFWPTCFRNKVRKTWISYTCFDLSFFTWIVVSKTLQRTTPIKVWVSNVKVQGSHQIAKVFKSLAWIIWDENIGKLCFAQAMMCNGQGCGPKDRHNKLSTTPFQNHFKSCPWNKRSIIKQTKTDCSFQHFIFSKAWSETKITFIDLPSNNRRQEAIGNVHCTYWQSWILAILLMYQILLQLENSQNPPVFSKVLSIKKLQGPRKHLFLQRILRPGKLRCHMMEPENDGFQRQDLIFMGAEKISWPSSSHPIFLSARKRPNLTCHYAKIPSLAEVPQGNPEHWRSAHYKSTEKLHYEALRVRCVYFCLYKDVCCGEGIEKLWDEFAELFACVFWLCMYNRKIFWTSWLAVDTSNISRGHAGNHHSNTLSLQSLQYTRCLLKRIKSKKKSHA